MFGEEDVGLYRDDGLAVSRGLSGSEAERAKKDVMKLFKAARPAHYDPD